MTLYLTEKGSQMRALADLMRLQKSGRVYKGRWKNEDVVIAALAGHILRLLNIDEYLDEKQSWEKLIKEGKIPFFPDRFKKKIKEKDSSRNLDYRTIFSEVKQWVDKADKIVLAPDPDNEGVTLAMEVIDYLKARDKVVGLISMNKLEKAALKEAVERVERQQYKNMYLAGEARGEYDWLFGINGTIAATVLLAGGKVVHIGGVKLPTIRLVVERDLEFEKFKKKITYTIKVRSGKNSFTIKDLEFDSSSEAEKLAKTLVGKEAVVEEQSSEIKSKKPAQPFTKTAIQSYLSKKYSISLEASNNILQKLYMNAFATYPRTSCPYYSSELYDETDSILSALKSEYGDFIAKLSRPYRKRPTAFNDSEVAKKSHTALAPTTKSFKADKNSSEWKVYDTIARRYLAQFAEDYRYKRYKTVAKLDNYILTNEENETVEMGWYEIEGLKREVRTISDLQKGDRLTIDGYEIVKKETKPKPRFNEATLLDAMERISRFYDDPLIKEKLKKSGIGTEATRDIILKQLIDKGYFEKKGRQIISTKKARELIEILPDSMTSPIQRAIMEEGLEKILETGEAGRREFDRKTREFIHKIIDDLKDLVNRGNKITSLLKPSEKQLKFAEDLARENSIELSEELKNDRIKLSEFIDKYSKNRKIDSRPSEKQLKFAEDLARENSIELTDELKSDRKKLSEFIDKYSKNRKKSRKGSSSKKDSKPTEKQLKYAYYLARKNSTKVPKEAKESRIKLSEFIEKYSKDE